MPGDSWYALGVLVLVYLLNFLDRQLIYILFPLIKEEMVLSDTQLALLGATSFVIFYTLLGIPFGRLADRCVRKDLIAAGLAFWSLFTGMTGFAAGFWAVFLCRVLVGVGEATSGPAGLSLLSDYFPARLRAAVSAVYSAGIPLGAGIGLFLGGLIGERLGWRWAFYVLGFPGILAAALVWRLREPERGITEISAAPWTGSDWRILFRLPSLRCHYLGYGLLAFSGYGMTIWAPSLLTRVHGMSLGSVGKTAGLSMLVGGLLGTLLGGYGADRWAAKRKGGRMLFTALGAVGAVPFWLGFLLASDLRPALGCYFFLTGFGLMWLGPAAAVVHDLVGPELRGLGVAVYFFIVNAVGLGLGPPLIGAITDHLGDPSRLRYSLLLCPLACAAAGLVLWRGARLIEREVLVG